MYLNLLHSFNKSATNTQLSFLALGANVTAHYNSNSTPIQVLQASFPALQSVQADLSSESAVKRMFEVLSGTPFSHVTVVVVNHGIWPPEDVPIVDMTIEQWDRTISANLTSSFLVCREYLRHLRAAVDSVKDKASIVLIGSTAGKYGEANHGDYAISKSGGYTAFTLKHHTERLCSNDVWHDDDTQKRDREDRSDRTGELYCSWMGCNADGTGGPE
jgi:NAD(P)-dependent dehydrogenase (short-subunit alcohol dehydrogenase family)